MMHDTTITGANDNAVSGATEHDVQRLMLALTRLLAGDKGDPCGAAFNAGLMVLVGAPLGASGLLWLADLARLNRHHAVHLSLEPSRPIPRIAFAYRQSDIVTVHEECFLAVRPGRDRIAIVPDSFADGAFQLGSDMKLKRREAPANFRTAMPLMQQANVRFAALLDSAVPTADRRPLRLSTR